jgi:endonuclease/exonuclease/phosphatase family metal-dependent hydrolase
LLHWSWEATVFTALILAMTDISTECHTISIGDFNFIKSKHQLKFKNTELHFFSLALQPPWALASAFQFHDHFTDGRTPWRSDQLVTRPLPKHRTTQT